LPLTELQDPPPSCTWGINRSEGNKKKEQEMRWQEKIWQMRGVYVCQSGGEMAITDKKVIAQRTIINN
jgi:hypothetical protein